MRLGLEKGSSRKLRTIRLLPVLAPLRECLVGELRRSIEGIRIVTCKLDELFVLGQGSKFSYRCYHRAEEPGLWKQDRPPPTIYLLSYPILSYPILSYPILSYPFLSYPFLSFPILKNETIG